MTNLTDVPDVFCWTKMGAEAGQPLDVIISRKEAERESGDGLFFWGIGTPLGQSIWRFIDSVSRPFVLFSPMKAKAKQIDSNPENVFIWTAYLDKNGIKHRMPEHVFVTSRGLSNGVAKEQHYALVCRKNSSLRGDEWPSIDRAKLKNYKRDSKLGFSQVTAVVECNKSVTSLGNNYDVLFGAELVEPYYVKLVDPIELPKNILANINMFWTNNKRSFIQQHGWLRSEIEDCCSFAGPNSHKDSLFELMEV
ncbi:MAG: hypothetical protein M0Q01_11490 [Syntrophales bacterium]|jgi:hypothetical protein|nr:hypothetical protein [Syntrophales bacterium]